MREHLALKLERLGRANGIGKEAVGSLLAMCTEEDRSCWMKVKRRVLELAARGRR